MATFSLPLTLPSPSHSKPKPRPKPICFSHSLKAFKSEPKKAFPAHNHKPNYGPLVRAVSLDFSGFSWPDDDPYSSNGPGLAVVEDKPEPQCPPGLRQYETMIVIRPDMNEDERLSLTHHYEELLLGGGGMNIEVFNRGVIPLSYSIKKKNKAGETNTYLDGIYLLFTYFTKPESMSAVDAALQTDDDVIRSSSFTIRKRKY